MIQWFYMKGNAMRYGILGCLLLGLLAMPLAMSGAAGSEPDPAAAAEQEPAWKAKAQKQLKAYPKAEEGMVRYVLFLEPKADESRFQVELIVGKVVETDGVNRVGFGSKLEKKTVKGWGYSMYVAPEDAFENMFSTRIGVPANQPKVKKFVALGGGPTLVRYNSKLPVVVYVPAGGEVRYRIWEASPEPTPMLPG